MPPGESHVPLRRSMRALAVLTVSLTASVGLVLPTATAKTAPLTGTLNTSSVLVGASASVTGKASPARRTVVLQRYSSGAWRTVVTARSSSTGSYRLTYVPKSAGSHSLRVYAPRSGSAASAKTGTLRLTARHRGAATATLSAATVIQGETSRLTGTISPTSTGRAVTLQRLSGTRWVTHASATTSSKGAYSFTLPTSTVSKTSYRVYAAQTSTLGSATSPSRTLTVQPPLAGPFVFDVSGVLGGGTYVTLTEVTGLHRERTVYTAPSDVDPNGLGAAAFSPSGRALLPWSKKSGGDVLETGGRGVARERIATSTSTQCLNWTAISPDGQHAVWGAGTLHGGFVCAPPASLTLRDLGAHRNATLTLKTSTSFGALDDTEFSRDSRYVLVRGLADFGDPVGQLFDTATGTELRASGMSNLAGYRLTDLPAGPGQLVMKRDATTDNPSGLWVLTVGSSTPRTPWAPAASIPAAGRSTLTASPDGKQLAWVAPVAGVPHVQSAPVATPSTVRDLGTLGFSSSGATLTLNWVGNTLLSLSWVNDTTGDGGGNVRSASTGSIVRNAPIAGDLWAF